SDAAVSTVDMFLKRDFDRLKSWKNFDDLLPAVRNYLWETTKQYGAISLAGAAGEQAASLIPTDVGMWGGTKRVLPLWIGVVRGGPILLGHLPSVSEASATTANVTAAHFLARTTLARPAVTATTRGLEAIGKIARLGRATTSAAMFQAEATFNLPEAIALSA